MTKVAVYGTLKQGEANHHYLSHLTPLSVEVLSGWSMFAAYAGGFPAIVRGDVNTKIQVEVYEVDTNTFKSLDRLEGYPSFYNREVVETSEGPAFIYFWDDAREDQMKCMTNVHNLDGVLSFSNKRS